MGLNGLTGVEATNIFREIRMVKSADEIAIIRDAARINEDGINAAIGALRPGAEWPEIERAYNIEMARQGGKGVYITPGTGGLPHGEIIAGEPVMLDGLGEYKHYHGDLGRTAVIGEPSPEILRRSKAMRAGWDTAFETVKPGVSGRQMTQKVLAADRTRGFSGLRHRHPPFGRP